jgi:hypothetical protein
MGEIIKVVECTEIKQDKNDVVVIHNDKEVFRMPKTKQTVDIAHSIYMCYKYKGNHCEKNNGKIADAETRKCGNCSEFGTVNCSETYREPTKNDDGCESFSPCILRK